jgi:hypothetical protein
MDQSLTLTLIVNVVDPPALLEHSTWPIFVTLSCRLFLQKQFLLNNKGTLVNDMKQIGEILSTLPPPTPKKCSFSYLLDNTVTKMLTSGGPLPPLSWLMSFLFPIFTITNAIVYRKVEQKF